MSVDYKIIGKRIKEKRRMCNLTQEKLAESLSVSVGYISQIERGITHVNLETLSNIASILGCDITELLSNVTVSADTFLTTEFDDILKSLNDAQRKMLLKIAYIIKES